MNTDMTIQLVDRDGTVRDTINTDLGFHDMTATADGELLLSDYSNECIRSVSRKKEISTLFRTSNWPTGLCCFHNSDIVVTFPNDRKVVVYNRNGDIRKKMEHIKLRYPMSVAVNRVNQDIYICDREHSFTYGGKLKAVGADGKLRYEYSGQGDKDFTPLDVCTDEMGRVITTDRDNDRVQILDQEGRFLYTVRPDLTTGTE